MEHSTFQKSAFYKKHRPGADAVKKLTPSLGIPYLGV